MGMRGAGVRPMLKTNPRYYRVPLDAGVIRICYFLHGANVASSPTIISQ